MAKQQFIFLMLFLLTLFLGQILKVLIIQTGEDIIPFFLDNFPKTLTKGKVLRSTYSQLLLKVIIAEHSIFCSSFALYSSITFALIIIKHEPINYSSIWYAVCIYLIPFLWNLWCPNSRMGGSMFRSLQNIKEQLCRIRKNIASTLKFCLSGLDYIVDRKGHLLRNRTGKRDYLSAFLQKCWVYTWFMLICFFYDDLVSGDRLANLVNFRKPFILFCRF